MRIITGAVLVFAMLSSAAAAGKKTINFSQENCSYRMVFDPGIVDEARARATIGFLYAEPGLPAKQPNVLSYADVVKADLPGYDAWCTAEAERLAGLKLLDVPGLEDLRKRRIAELRDQCELVSREVEGGRGNVDALKHYARAHPYCDRYIDRLAMNDKDFVPAWRAFATEHCLKNSNKPTCKNADLQWLKKPDGMQRLRADMLVFGWYNCANEHSIVNEGQTPTTASDSMRLRDEVAAHFVKALKIKSLGCENAD